MSTRPAFRSRRIPLVLTHASSAGLTSLCGLQVPRSALAPTDGAATCAACRDQLAAIDHLKSRRTGL